MRYHKEDEGFEYWADNAIDYKYLESVARKYVTVFSCRDLYIERFALLKEKIVNLKEQIAENKRREEEKEEDKTSGEEEEKTEIEEPRQDPQQQQRRRVRPVRPSNARVRDGAVNILTPNRRFANTSAIDAFAELQNFTQNSNITPNISSTSTEISY